MCYSFHGFSQVMEKGEISKISKEWCFLWASGWAPHDFPASRTSWSTTSQPSLEPHKILSSLLAVNDCRFLVSILCFPLQVLEFLLLNRKTINLSIYLVKKFCIFLPYVVVGHVMNRNTFQFVLKSDSGNTCSYLPFSRQNSSGKMSWKFHENPSKTLNMMSIIIPEKNRYAPIIPEKKT